MTTTNEIEFYKSIVTHMKVVDESIEILGNRVKELKIKVDNLEYHLLSSANRLMKTPFGEK